MVSVNCDLKTVFFSHYFAFLSFFCDDNYVLIDELKHNFSLNLISILGYSGFVLLIYYLILARNMHNSFPFIPLMTLDDFCNYWVFSVKTTCFLVLTAVLEHFLYEVPILYNLKSFLKKYFNLISNCFFVIGCFIALMSAFFYWYFYLPPGLAD